MKTYLYFFCFIGIFFLYSCNPQETKSLLTTFQVCTENCTTAEQTQIEGDLSIDPESSQTPFYVDKGDLVEINGTCSDLGRKNNRIIVNVFENEDDESVLPYVDNTISSNCQPSVSIASGMTTSQQCFFVTQGKGLTESGQVYPQCINGRFSFMVRVGNVSKVAAVVKNYLIRMKLRTTDGITSESGWARTSIKREVSVPQFSLKTDYENLRCEVKIEGFKFKHSPYNTDNIPDIRYMVRREHFGYTAAGIANNIAISDRFSTFMSYDVTRVDAGDSVANFYDDGIPINHTVLLVNPSGVLYIPPQPGTKYNYFVQARAGSDDSAVSSAKVCEMPPPNISTVSTSPTVCSATLDLGVNSNFNYYWEYGTASGWSKTQVSGTPTLCGFSDYTCNFTMPLATGTYFLAVRTMYAGVFGKWSDEVKCVKP